MATEDRTETTVSLPEKAYDRLEERRRDGEDVADVLDRLDDEEVAIYRGFGIFADVDTEDSVATVKREMDEDFEERIDEMFRQ